MSSGGIERRLAAILSADVVGYGRLRAADESGTVRHITAYREQVGAFVREHRGRLVDFSGDCFLAEFSSPVDAATCAAEIQRELKEENVGRPEDHRMQFRIGIHLGDVRVEGERIFGDGVNIAARLEALAEPGGICVSSKVRDEIESQLEFGYEDLGEQSLKNIPKPVHAYRLRLEPQRAAAGARPSQGRLMVATVTAAIVLVLAVVAIWRSVPRGGDQGGPGLQPGSIRALAVLPLDDLSGNTEQAYFTDAMTEALISDLAKIASLDVVSRTSVMQYRGARKPLPEIARELDVDAVVEGSVLRVGQAVRITVQLVDARNDRHLWSESYERDLSDILSLQREVAQAIAEEIRLQLGAADESRLRPTPPVNPEAYEAYIKGRFFLRRVTREDHSRAVEYFKEAVRLDPEYAPAWAGLADGYT